jgi:general secretion pathway protein L
VIRLGSEAVNTIHWLIWSQSEREIIASGDLSGAEHLAELTERAQSRDVVILVPGESVALYRVEMPAGSRRQMTQALPFLLEDKLAEDIETLHITALGYDKETVSVAVISDEKMQLWQEWLDTAQIASHRWMPDLLALPEPGEQVACALKIDEQWLLRSGKYEGVSIDESWLSFALPKLCADTRIETLHHYSDAPVIDGDDSFPHWVAQEAELPMALLTHGAIMSNINLLQGRYEKQDRWLHLWMTWRKAAIAAAVLFVLMLVNLVLEGNRIEAQIEQTNQELHLVYQKVFPDATRVRDSRIRNDFKRAIAALESGGSDSGLLAMLLKLAPAFQQSPDLAPSSLRYDLKRGEIQLQATAKSFQNFEQFKASAAPLIVETGALSKKPEGVIGTLTIRNPS